MALSRLCLVIPFVLFATACDLVNQEPQRAPVVQTEVRVPVVDPRNLVCPDIPIPPDPDTSEQSDVAAYLPQIVEVAEHCKRDLQAVRATLVAAQVAADAANDPES
jgi:hypothetical protein